MTLYYKIINIPSVLEISQEVDAALRSLVTGAINLKQVSSFNIIDPIKLLNLCPTLCNWLDTVGLKDNLKYAGLPWTAPLSQGKIHTDGKCTEAINIPIYNCKNGYSVWYQANRIGNILETDSGKSTDQVAEFVPYSDLDAVELAKVSNQHPIWFNTSIPHRGVNLSDLPRIILTLRFDCPIPVDKLCL
jgi:hypothetical protein